MRANSQRVEAGGACASESDSFHEVITDDQVITRRLLLRRRRSLPSSLYRATPATHRGSQAGFPANATHATYVT